MDHQHPSAYLHRERLPNNGNNAEGTWGKNARSSPTIITIIIWVPEQSYNYLKSNLDFT